MSGPRILVAGIGNILRGGDAFGVVVVRRLANRTLPEGLTVRDFGIRGFDLAMALTGDCDVAVLVDATRRGGTPGTVYLMEVDSTAMEGTAELDLHGMVPTQVLRAVRSIGGTLGRILIVACEPEDFGDPDAGRVGLSPRVEAAIPEAIRMIEGLLEGALHA